MRRPCVIWVMAASSPSQPTPSSLDALETSLRELLEALPSEEPRARRAGAPPIVAAFPLWCGFLVCILRGFSAQLSLWRLLTSRGLWGRPPVHLTSQALYQRLARTPADAILTLFAQVTTVLRQRFAAVCDVPYAPFASEILALDHSTLDAVLRKLKLFRGLARTDPVLLPGQLATLFDVRRQLFYQVEFWPDAKRNEKHNVTHWLDLLPEKTLLLFDLGFYAFHWFDALTAREIYFVSRQREKISHTLCHTFFDGPAGPVHLKDTLVYLGAYRADRAAHAVRLIEITWAQGTRRYLTNVLDPQLLPARHVVELYRRRWDIEQAFNLLKTHLNLFLVWSGHRNVVHQQVFGTLIIAQVVLGLRTEVAILAKAPLREVSLSLLMRWIPEYALAGLDPVATLVKRGRLAGIIRPCRRQEYQLPPAHPAGYALPTERPPPRKARYAGKQGKGDSSRVPFARAARKQGWGLRARRVRTR